VVASLGVDNNGGGGSGGVRVSGDARGGRHDRLGWSWWLEGEGDGEISCMTGTARVLVKETLRR
jgi:hypothetical protein